jgi:hypothetical protein
VPEPQVIGQRALNRALLARQLLLQRAGLPPLAAIEHLAGMQAQAPRAPYVGLWTRLAGFLTGDLEQLITGRQAVRTHVMRNTIHLVSAADCVRIHGLLQPVLERGFASSPFARNIAGADLDAVRTAGRALLAERPRTRSELSGLLGGRWPGQDPISLAYAVTHLEPTVQVPPRGIWSATGQATYTTTKAWLGRRTAPGLTPDEFAGRYLAAFGPATVADLQAWSGLTRMREVFDRLRRQLRTFRGEHGGEYFDLPDAPRPDPQTPAPPRFLPEYDNILLSHADRSRIIADGRAVPLPPGSGGTSGTLLVDGLWRGVWKITRRRAAATLHVAPFARLSGQDAAAVTAEGGRLLAFITAGAGQHDVRLAPPA